MIITQEQLEQLARIYNTFLNINTRGEDTFIMADCLRALERVIKEIDESNSSSTNSAVNNNKPGEVYTPEVISE